MMCDRRLNRVAGRFAVQWIALVVLLMIAPDGLAHTGGDGQGLVDGHELGGNGECLACKDRLLGALGAIFGTLFSLAAAITGGLGAGIESVVGAASRGPRRFAGRVWGGLVGKFLDGVSAVLGPATAVFQSLLGLGTRGSRVAAKGLETMAGWAQAVPGIVARGAEGFANVGLNVAGSGADAARGGLEAAGNIGEAAVNGVKNLLTNVYQAATK